MKKIILIITCLLVSTNIFSQSQIHVYWPIPSDGELCTIKVSLDGKLLGKIRWGGWKTFDVESVGTLNLTAKSRCAFKKKEITISLSEGSSHYVEIGMNLKMYIQEFDYKELAESTKKLFPAPIH